MDKLRALQYFIAAAEEGSFAGAARQLEVSVPAVHKLIRALEGALGVVLFERSVRGLTLTASGEAYLGSCRPLLDELAALDESMSRSADSPSGVLVVGAPPQLAHHFLMPALPRFRARCPEVQIDLRVVHRTSDTDAAAVDVFLLHGWPEVNDLVHRRLGHERSVIAAAPSYWAQRGIVQHPDDLARHACLVLRNPAGTLIDLWEFERGGQTASVKVGGWICSNSREIVLDAVLTGEGVGRFSTLATRAHLQSGRLVPVLLDWEVKGGPPLNLLYRPAHRRTPRVRVFLDFVMALLQELESDDPGSLQRGLVERPKWYRQGYGRASATLRWRT